MLCWIVFCSGYILLYSSVFYSYFFCLLFFGLTSSASFRFPRCDVGKWAVTKTVSLVVVLKMLPHVISF